MPPSLDTLIRCGLVCALGAGTAACRPRPVPAAADAAVEQRAAMRTTPPREPAPFSPRPLVRCFGEDASGAAARPLGVLLDRAIELHDHAEFAAALVCAEEATRVDPRSIEAHEDRALALAELGRKDEARAAMGRALSIDPDDPRTLVTAADLLLNRLATKEGATPDDAATALEHALRGLDRLRRARGKTDRPLRARLELLAGQSLSDLGRAKEALPHLDAALIAAPDDLTTRYERGVALFDLCRFPEAERALREVVAKDPEDAFAHQQLGLVLEQLGDRRAAERELAEARRLNPAEVRAPIELARSEFERAVRDEIAALPPALRTDLAKVDIELPDLPAIADLTADDPPLPPTILGLFRGAPLSEAPGAQVTSRHGHGHGEATMSTSERRAIALYRLNLARAVQSPEELRQQIRTTLHHELGHLRGEDDEALRARGLE